MDSIVALAGKCRRDMPVEGLEVMGEKRTQQKCFTGGKAGDYHVKHFARLWLLSLEMSIDSSKYGSTHPYLLFTKGG